MTEPPGNGPEKRRTQDLLAQTITGDPQITRRAHVSVCSCCNQAYRHTDRYIVRTKNKPGNGSAQAGRTSRRRARAIDESPASARAMDMGTPKRLALLLEAMIWCGTREESHQAQRSWSLRGTATNEHEFHEQKTL